MGGNDGEGGGGGVLMKVTILSRNSACDIHCRIYVSSRHQCTVCMSDHVHPSHLGRLSYTSPAL